MVSNSLPVIYVGQLDVKSLSGYERKMREAVIATAKLQSTDIEYIPARQFNDCVWFAQDGGAFNNHDSCCFIGETRVVPSDGSGFCHEWSDK